MKVTSIIAAVLVFAAPSFAQSATELLQKGIYAQETFGNLDEAISIYRQIAGAATGQPNIAAQAQYGLAEAYVQKGDLTTAASEFQKLARDHPEQQRLLHGSKVGIALQRAGVLPAIPSVSAGPAGVLQNGHYHHNVTGTEFDLPAGWSLGVTKPIDGDPREMTVLVDPDGRAVFSCVTGRIYPTAPCTEIFR